MSNADFAKNENSVKNSKNRCQKILRNDTCVSYHTSSNKNDKCRTIEKKNFFLVKFRITVLLHWFCKHNT